MTDAEHSDNGTRAVCGTDIEYFEHQQDNGIAGEYEVLDSWWSHLVHPADNHEAVPREGVEMGERETAQQKARRLRQQGHTLDNICRVMDIDPDTALKLLNEDGPYRQEAPEEDFPYRKAALNAAVEAWRDWFWTDGKPDAGTAAAEILGFAERFLPWLRGEQPEAVEETPTGIYVRYTVDGKTWVQHIEERFVPGHARERDNLLDAAGEYLIALHGSGGKMEYELPYSTPPKTEDTAEGAEE